MIEADANVSSNELVLDDGLGNDLSLDNGATFDALGYGSGNITE